jgi:hypothetical protein
VRVGLVYAHISGRAAAEHINTAAAIGSDPWGLLLAEGGIPLVVGTADPDGTGSGARHREDTQGEDQEHEGAGEHGNVLSWARRVAWPERHGLAVRRG